MLHRIVIAASAVFGTAALGACVGMSSCSMVGWKTESKTAMQTVAAAPGRLEVTTANGSVEVRRAEASEVSIEATFHAETKERLEQMKVVTQPNVAGGVSVSVQWPPDGRRGNEGCSLKISTPAVDGLKLHTDNGSITAGAGGGFKGEAVLESSNGSVTISDQAGVVNAKTSNASIRVEKATGAVTAQSSNGRIEVTDVGGAVNATTSNASIRVKLASDNSQAFKLKSSNGGVTVELGSAFAGVVDAETSNGSVKMSGAAGIDGSGPRAKGTFGSSGGKSTIETSNGSVEVSKAK